MKKLMCALFAVLCVAGFVFAQEQEGLVLSGELKTGLFWYQLDRAGQELDEGGFIYNSDAIEQAGKETLQNYWSENGRFRLNFLYNRGTIGVKFRFETTQWTTGRSTTNALSWDYAFVYGNFFNNNLKLSAGKMGDSPWGAGGPDLWTELDTTMGIRFEFLPQFIPFIKPGSLNLGFVLNNFDGSVETQAGHKQKTLKDILTESVLGLSYTHEGIFHLRLSYRLDGLVDEGMCEKFVYRIEERIIQKYLPGFQIVANGFWDYLNPRKLYTPEADPNGDRDPRDDMRLYNWQYINYDSPLVFSPLDMSFRALFRFGYESVAKREKLFVKPGFYLTFFNNFLQIGTAFEYSADVGELRLDDNAPYRHWYIEPEIRLNILKDSYISFVYRYYNDYEFFEPGTGNTVNTKTHWINLRVLFTF